MENVKKKKIHRTFNCMWMDSDIVSQFHIFFYLSHRVIFLDLMREKRRLLNCSLILHEGDEEQKCLNIRTC